MNLCFCHDFKYFLSSVSFYVSVTVSLDRSCGNVVGETT